MSLPETRILTVRQPYAWAIIHAGKNIENRAQNLARNYRGPVAIHAGKEWADPHQWGDQLEAALAEQGMLSEQLPTGAIIGVVDIVGAHSSIPNPNQHPTCWGPGERMGSRGSGYCSPWATAADYHLELANPHALAEPIPYTGALGLRRLDDAIHRQIESRGSHQ